MSHTILLSLLFSLPDHGTASWFEDACGTPSAIPWYGGCLFPVPLTPSASGVEPLRSESHSKTPETSTAKCGPIAPSLSRSVPVCCLLKQQVKSIVNSQVRSSRCFSISSSPHCSDRYYVLRALPALMAAPRASGMRTGGPAHTYYYRPVLTA